MEWLMPLIGLASSVLERSSLKEKKEYTEKLAKLEIEINRELQKPPSEQDDLKVMDLKIQIKAIVKVAEHEARIILNS